MFKPAIVVGVDNEKEESSINSNSLGQQGTFMLSKWDWVEDISWLQMQESNNVQKLQKFFKIGVF